MNSIYSLGADEEEPVNEEMEQAILDEEFLTDNFLVLYSNLTINLFKKLYKKVGKIWSRQSF